MHDHYISMNLSLTQNINAANSSFIIQTITHTGLTPVHVWAVLHVPATGGRPIALELLKILLHRTADPLALADNGDTLLHLLARVMRNEHMVDFKGKKADMFGPVKSELLRFVMQETGVFVFLWKEKNKDNRTALEVAQELMRANREIDKPSDKFLVDFQSYWVAEEKRLKEEAEGAERVGGVVGDFRSYPGFRWVQCKCVVLSTADHVVLCAFFTQKS